MQHIFFFPKRTEFHRFIFHFNTPDSLKPEILYLIYLLMANCHICFIHIYHLMQYDFHQYIHFASGQIDSATMQS